MNRTVPLSMDDGARIASPGSRIDHTAEMRAIAAQLERLSGSVTRGQGQKAPVADGAGRLDILREAVAAISRRQADLDGHGDGPADPLPAPMRDAAPGPAAPPAPVLTAASHVPSAQRLGAPPDPTGAGELAGRRRASIDLPAEVSQTFARFSRDLRDAIHAADAGPKVEEVGQAVPQIGRAVEDLGSGLPGAGALDRIGEQTREMRDLLRASAARTAPLDTVEHQVASLEARLGRPASTATGAPAVAAPPVFGDTMAEVRTLLDGLGPDATVAALETRLDAITDRIERKLDARGPSTLIEGLSRRVDEIHASLRSQLIESAVDTRPLEGLVRGLTDRIGQAREASADFNQLEAAVRDAAAKIDGAASGLDARGVQAVEAQLVKLGERLDRSEASLGALDGVEQMLGDLFSQFEVTRQVAIDAAETAARTAARDTLRAALQNPNFAHRPSDIPSAAVDQMARSIDGIRVLQDTAERRTQSALSDIQIAMGRLTQQLAAASVSAAAPEARRHRPAEERVAAPPAASRDPMDVLIEPGHGAGGAGQQPIPELGLEADADPSAPTPTVDGDGPASFIAAARRAAHAAQASVAVKTVERRPVPRTAAGAGTLGRAKLFLWQRRRPILLSLAALVLIVGAFEAVNLSSAPVEAARVSDVAAPVRTRVASTAASPAADAPHATPAELATAALPTVAPPTPPLPTFVAGSAKVSPPADRITDGLRTAAASGDPAAQYEVGLRFVEGRGMSRDPKQAVAWFEKAAARGLVPAEYRLGAAYEKGVGVDRDPGLAASWYGKAADAGNVRAMHNLAVMSAEGAGGKPDYAKAAQWFGKASAYGVRDSQFNLAILCARGLGIEQSLTQSYTWFAIAAAGGDEDAGKKRDEVATKLDPKSLGSAKAAAEAFHAAAPTPSANDVASPPGGWDAVGASTPSGDVNAKVSQL